MKKIAKLFLSIALIFALTMSLATPAEAKTIKYKNYDYNSGVLNVKISKSVEKDVLVLAKVIAHYGRDIKDRNTQAAIGWVVLNSADTYEKPLSSVQKAAKNFKYSSSWSYKDYSGYDCRKLARDLILRWRAEKSGIKNVYRIVPKKYIWLWREDGKIYIRYQGLHKGTALKIKTKTKPYYKTTK